MRRFIADLQVLCQHPASSQCNSAQFSDMQFRPPQIILAGCLGRVQKVFAWTLVRAVSKRPVLDPRCTTFASDSCA